MLNKLKMLRDYAIDERLREFRKVSFNKNFAPVIKFISFDSTKGKKLLQELNKEHKDESNNAAN